MGNKWWGEEPVSGPRCCSLFETKSMLATGSGPEFPGCQSAVAVQLTVTYLWGHSVKLYFISEVPTLPALILDAETVCDIFSWPVSQCWGPVSTLAWCPHCWGREGVSLWRFIACWRVKWGQVRGRRSFCLLSDRCHDVTVWFEIWGRDISNYRWLFGFSVCFCKWSSIIRTSLACYVWDV